MFDFFPEWFQIFFGSMVPFLESRYILPYAMWEFNWQWWEAFPLAIIGNILPIPFVLIFFKYVEKYLRNFVFWSNIMDKIFERTRIRANKKIDNYETLGLLLFVAIPLPFTGAWTGSLIAYLFDLNFYRSLLIIFLGIIISVSIMIVLYSMGVIIWISING
ncbi:MAG: small multi-drug export protein [Candidatus Thermoplasmatota archaeon]|nr:small multi-drug export protein [Candidatus Thermoplasmatota archaeon]